MTPCEGCSSNYLASYTLLRVFSGTASTIEHYGDTMCIVYNNGKVLWVPPSLFVALCELDLRLWPFDTQVCSLKFGSWTYDSQQIDMRIDNRQEVRKGHYNFLSSLFFLRCTSFLARALALKAVVNARKQRRYFTDNLDGFKLEKKRARVKFFHTESSFISYSRMGSLSDNFYRKINCKS